MRIDYWRAKAYFHVGDYKSALHHADAQIASLAKKYTELEKEFGSK